MQRPATPSKLTGMTPHHDIAGPTSIVGAVGFAAVPWVSNLELGLRVVALALSIVASIYAIHHYREK